MALMMTDDHTMIDKHGNKHFFVGEYFALISLHVPDDPALLVKIKVQNFAFYHTFG
ncbi:MAG: hypothetical protein PF590_01080 [Candidatus Delongbacteria bacterium]|jgi:hypothetical protein|nr:hypothetical protein [Candidatus Delongbacteria bacterium]